MGAWDPYFATGGGFSPGMVPRSLLSLFFSFFSFFFSFFPPSRFALPRNYFFQDSDI